VKTPENAAKNEEPELKAEEETKEKVVI